MTFHILQVFGRIGLLFLCQLFILHTSYAFTTTFTSPAISCGAFTVHWSTSDNSAQPVPPFKLILVPVNEASAAEASSTGLGISTAVPVEISIPSSTDNWSNGQGTYTVPNLPFEAGSYFIVVMDDGNGNGTGGVSGIQKVETGTDNGCLPHSGANSETIFTFSTHQPEQCGNLEITSAPPLAIRGFIPNGSPFSLDLPTSNDTTTVKTEWTMNVPQGTNFVLMLELGNGTLASSGLLGSQGGQSGSACLVGAPHSTVTASGTNAPAQATTSSTPSKGKLNTAALAAGIVGGLAFLAFVAILVFFCILRKTDSLGRHRSRSRSTVSPYGGRSYEFTNTSRSGDSAWGRINGGGAGGKANGSNTKPVEDNLEGRLGGLFGTGKKKSKGSGSGERRERTMTSSRKREMYPGLSFASTQNRSIGVMSTEEGFGEEIPPTPAIGNRNGDRAPPGVVANKGPSAWRDAKRDEARHQARPSTGAGSSYVSGATESADGYSNTVRDEGTNLSRNGSGGHHSQSSRSRTQSLTQSNQHSNGSSAMLLKDSTGERTSDRPSTAPGQGALRDYHLPTRRAMHSDNGHGRVDSGHEYPPDLKQRSTSLLHDDTYDVGDDTEDEVPKVREGVVPTDDEVPEETEEELESFGGSRSRGWVHPYAAVESPHADVTLPFSQSRQRPSAQSPPTRRDRTLSPPTIIRHVDAGPMMNSDDEEENGRKVVELPPSYGDVTHSRRRRE